MLKTVLSRIWSDFPQYDKIFFSSIPAIDLLSDSTGTDMVMMTIKNFDFLDNEIEEYDVSTFHSSVYTGSTLSKVGKLQKKVKGIAASKWHVHPGR